MAALNLQALRAALKNSILIDWAEIDAIPEAKLSGPDSFLSEIYENYTKNKKTQKRVSGKRLVAVIIAAILIIASAVTAFAYKEKLLRFFERKEATHTSLISPGTNDANEEIKEVWLPTYIPEDFQLKSTEFYVLLIETTWTNGEKEIRLNQTPIKNTDYSLNTETSNYLEITFGTQPIYYTINHGNFGAIWHTDDYVYRFDAPYDLGLEEIERIITSIALDG